MIFSLYDQDLEVEKQEIPNSDFFYFTKTSALSIKLPPMTIKDFVPLLISSLKNKEGLYLIGQNNNLTNFKNSHFEKTDDYLYISQTQKKQIKKLLSEKGCLSYEQLSSLIYQLFIKKL